MAIATRAPVQGVALQFKQFIKNIRPKDKRLDAAQRYPTLARDFLKRTGLLATVDPHSRLTGSYGREIAIHEIKDVDFVVCLDPKYRGLGATRALEDLKTALDAMANELEKDLSETLEVELREQRRSVRVKFVDEDFYLDVVPVLIRQEDPDGVEGTLDVPDREWKSWQPTACVGYSQAFSDLNGEAGGKLIGLMMILKHWRWKWLKRNQAKSFWIEALVVDLIRSGAIIFKDKSLAEVVANAFSAIENRCAPYLAFADAKPFIPDPMIPLLNRNVAFNWERGDFETFMRRIDEAVTQSTKAVAATTAADAVTAWQKLFGDEWFPTTIEEETKAANAAALAAATAVSRTGAVILNPGPQVHATPTPAHKYHGEEESR